MKKLLLGILVLGFLLSSNAYAELEIFSISCEGTITSSDLQYKNDFYEDLEVYVHKTKRPAIGTIIRKSSSHPMLRSENYIPPENVSGSGWGTVSTLDAKQLIVQMVSHNNISEDGKYKLIRSKFRLSFVSNSLMGNAKYVFENEEAIMSVKTKCLGMEKIKKYLNII